MPRFGAISSHELRVTRSNIGQKHGTDSDVKYLSHERISTFVTKARKWKSLEIYDTRYEMHESSGHRGVRML